METIDHFLGNLEDYYEGIFPSQVYGNTQSELQSYRTSNQCKCICIYMEFHVKNMDFNLKNETPYHMVLILP